MKKRDSFSTFHRQTPQSWQQKQVRWQSLESANELIQIIRVKTSDLEILLSSRKQFLLVFLADVCHIGNIYVMLLGEVERTHNCM